MRKITIIAAWLLVNSCTFQPDGDSLTEVEVPPPTDTVINFFESQDTLLVRGHFSFSATTSSSERIKDYSFFVDGQLVQSGEGSPQSLPFRSQEFPDGIHTVTLEITKYVNGESIASQLDLEFYKQSYSRKIQSFNKAIVAPVVTASIVDSVLVVQWAPYTDPGFHSYVIASPDVNFYETIEDAGQSSVQVPSYFGGHAGFYITLNAFNEEPRTIFSYESFYEAEIEKTEEGMRYSWLGSPFSSSAGFKITMNSGNQNQVINFDNAAGSVDVAASYTFPNEIEGTLHVLSDNGDEILLKRQESSSIQLIGGTNPQYHDFKQFIPVNDTLLLISCALDNSGRGRVALHHRVTGEELGMIGGVNAISPDGRYIYHYNDYAEIVQLDPTDLSETGERISFQTMTGTVQLWQLHVSNDNKLLMHARPTGLGTYYGFDWETKSVMFTSSPTLSVGIQNSGVLGNGGRKFYHPDDRRAYTIDTNPITTKLAFPNLDRNRIMGHVDRFIVQSGTFLYIYDLDANLLYSAAATNNISNTVRIITGGENEFGVLYTRDGKTKIDFFDYRDLSLLQSLETQIPTSLASYYVFHLAQGELFGYLYQNYDQGPVHHIKLDF
jgi:hypothetical protein